MSWETECVSETAYTIQNVDFSDYQNMKDKNKNIVRLIVKEIILGLNNTEKEKLDAWLIEDENNRYLFNAIKNSTNFRKWRKFREADNQQVWEIINRSIQKKKKYSLLQSLLKIASVVLLFLIIGSSIYFFMPRNVEKTLPIVEIDPGSRNAFLILDDGETVALNDTEETLIVEKDGSLIKKAENKLDYSVQEDSGTDSILFNTLLVPRGSEYDLVLSDGTRVFLNAMSEFRYPVRFKGNFRKVILQGEAYFEVAHSEFPFIVTTNQLDLEVLGTSFNINAYENSGNIITTLVEGKLKVVSAVKPEENWILLPNDQAIYNLDKKNIKVEKVDVSLFTSWKDGELNFHDMRLEDIMTILTRWYSAEVFYLDSSIRDLRFTGSLDKYENINYILDIIESTKKVKIEINGNEIGLRKVL